MIFNEFGSIWKARNIDKESLEENESTVEADEPTVEAAEPTDEDTETAYDVNEIIETHKIGQPVLVGTISIEKLI